MATRIWTPSQQEAISCDRHDILVSAAAGSGKTAVLTQRIINELTDPDHPADISRMLIVTYTKAAAGELKERISKALSEAIAAHPENKRLRRQYVLLGSARISTIHSFCLDLVRQNFERLGLSPSVSISDDTQAKLLRKQVADSVIENYYAKIPGYDDIEDFIGFADNFITLNDSRLSDILLSLYEKIASYPQGVAFFKESAEEYQGITPDSFYRTHLGEFLIQHLADAFRYYRAVLEEACACYDTDIFRDKYYPAFFNDYTMAERSLTALEAADMETFTQQLFSFEGVPLRAVKSELQNEKTLFFKEFHAEFQKFLRTMAEQFFSTSPDQISELAAQSAGYLADLYRFLSTFERRYRYEKRIRGLLDFNDLERHACELLTDSEGKPTPLAISLSEELDEIYIDEYQDVNKLQDLIFSALSCHARRFMVGDIKQSIYGFRGGEPSLFADYRMDPSIHKIFLSHNFRCDPPIIAYVNTVCGNLFTGLGTTVPYDKTDALVCGKEGGLSNEVELYLLECEEASASEKRAAEASFVAERIETLLNEGTKASDICILLRATSRSAVLFADALEAKGIPCHNDVKRNLFENPEVLLVINFLQVIDNPSRDINLAGLLKSPLFNLTLSELVTIRRASPEGSLYDALRAYAHAEDFEKGRYFLAKLQEFRKLANEPVDSLLYHLYSDSHLIALVTARDDEQTARQKNANLMALYELARSFESGTFKGLYHFIRYITDLLEQEADVCEPAPPLEGLNAVRIMSIHQSKGLEFPVVFLCDTASPFNEKDSTQAVLIDRHFGASLKISDSTGMATIDTLFRQIEASAISRKAADEEIRVLYVALTRAISRLIITGSVKHADQIQERCQQLGRLREVKGGYLYSKHKNYLEWLLLAGGETVTPRVVLRSTPKATVFDQTDSVTLPKPLFTASEVAALAEEYRRRFSFVYPNTAAATIPAKLSVSELYPTILDDYSDAEKLADTRRSNIKRPRFAADSTESGAERGTATHQFMQFCDFNRLASTSVEEEIRRLTALGFLSEPVATLIRRDAIEAFLKTDLFQSLRGASFIRRELRFNIRLPAHAFTADSEKRSLLHEDTVLVQGIMDCIFTDRDGRLTVLDYKTDSIPHEFSDLPEKAEQYLIDRHREQLSYYRIACERMLCRSVDCVLLYSFALGKAIEIPLSSLVIG